jgi:hypothetical protein
MSDVGNIKIRVQFTEAGHSRKQENFLKQDVKAVFYRTALYPEDRASKFLRKVSKYSRDYATS